MVNLLFGFSLFAISLFAIAWARRKTGDFANPAAIVVAAWATALGLFLLRMLPYPAVPAAAAVALLLGVGSLLAGILLAGPLTRRDFPSEWPAFRPAAWVVAFSVLGLGGTAWYGWEVHRLFGLDALLHDATSIRTALADYSIPSRFLFLQFFCMIAPILAFGLALAGTRLGLVPWSLAATCAVSTWITTDRTQFFTIVLTCFFMYFIRRGRDLSLGRAGGAMLVAAAALAANFLAVGYWTGKSPENLGFSLSAPRWEVESDPPAVQNKYVGVVLRKSSTLYLYATGSFAAFALWYPPETPPTYGVHSLYPVARLLQRSGVIQVDLPSPILRFVEIVRRGNGSILFNGYTFLYYPISDFGLGGMVIYCLLAGLLVGTLYERTRRARSSAPHLLLMGQVSMALTLSIFVNKFNNTASWYLALMTTAPFWVSALVLGVRKEPR